MSSKSLLLAVAMVLLATVAAATSLMKVSVETLTDRAALIVLGDVEAVQGKLEEGGIVSTYVTFASSYVYKGSYFKSYQVRVPGGTVGDKSMKVFGAPQFKPGERLLLFLEKDYADPKAYRVSGFFQGRYLIFKVNETSYTVMDQGKGSQIFEDCQGDRVTCLKEKGLDVRPYAEMTTVVKGRVEELKRKDK